MSADFKRQESVRTGVRIMCEVTLGLGGSLLLGAYLILVTFLPRVKDMALAFAAPGGLMAIAWMLLMALRLFLPWSALARFSSRFSLESRSWRIQ